MVATTTKGFSIIAGDVSGQREVRVRGVSPDGTVGELVDGLVDEMRLVNRVEGRPLSYSARLDREGRHLHAAERVSDVLQEDDRIVLAPSIDAG